MSLDVDLLVTKPTSVYSANITHNLTKMASAVVFDNQLTLYQILWRPEEVGMYFARDITEWLDKGYQILVSDPHYYKTYNPENGWGSYDGLVQFVREYRNACHDNPDAELSVCR